MPASNRRTAGGSGCRWASSMPTRRATTSFSQQVLTNSRYFWRLSKKRKLRDGAPSAAGGLHLQARYPCHPQQRHQLARRRRRLDALARQEGADPLQGLRRDAGAIPQTRNEFAIVDGPPAEGRLGHARAPAELGDAVQQSDGRVCHRRGSLVRLTRLCRRLGGCSWEGNHKRVPHGSGYFPSVSRAPRGSSHPAIKVSLPDAPRRAAFAPTFSAPSCRHIRWLWLEVTMRCIFSVIAGLGF